MISALSRYQRASGAKKRAIKRVSTKWRTAGTLWVASFLCSFILFELAGRVVVPQFFPTADVGAGFTTPDSTGFHQIAVRQAEIIRQGGWTKWSLFPENHFPAGYASVLYALFGSQREVLWLFQAALHAANTLLIFLILRHVFAWVPAAVGATYYLLYPASLEFTFNLHKDIFFSLGCYLLLWAFLQTSRPTQESPWSWTGILGIVVAGILVKLSRAYVYPVLYFLALLVPLRVFLESGSRRWGKVALVALLALFPLWSADKIMHGIPIRLKGEASLDQENRGVPGPLDNRGVPGPLDKQQTPGLVKIFFMNYQNARMGFNQTEGRSRLDHDFVPKDLKEFVFYIPRGLQIGLFSPWPTEWGTPGSSTSVTIWKKLLFVYGPLNYLAMGLLMVAFVAGPKRIEIGIIVLFCLLVIVFFAMIVSNVGALNRFRNPPYLLLVATGLAWGSYRLMQLRRLPSASRKGIIL